MNNPQWFIKQTQHRESLTELVHLFSTLAEKVANIILLFKFCDLEKLLKKTKKVLLNPIIYDSEKISLGKMLILINLLIIKLAE